MLRKRDTVGEERRERRHRYNENIISIIDTDEDTSIYKEPPACRYDYQSPLCKGSIDFDSTSVIKIFDLLGQLTKDTTEL